MNSLLPGYLQWAMVTEEKILLESILIWVNLKTVVGDFIMRGEGAG
jgi:hypothetical protein